MCAFAATGPWSTEGDEHDVAIVDALLRGQFFAVCAFYVVDDLIGVCEHEFFELCTDE